MLRKDSWHHKDLWVVEAEEEEEVVASVVCLGQQVSLAYPSMRQMFWDNYVLLRVRSLHIVHFCAAYSQALVLVFDEPRLLILTRRIYFSCSDQ